MLVRSICSVSEHCVVCSSKIELPPVKPGHLSDAQGWSSPVTNYSLIEAVTLATAAGTLLLPTFCPSCPPAPSRWRHELRLSGLRAGRFALWFDRGDFGYKDRQAGLSASGSILMQHTLGYGAVDDA